MKCHSIIPKLGVALVTFICISCCFTQSAIGQIARFSQTTDTIQVLGQTVLGSQATVEAVVLFTGNLNGEGNIFNEWTNNFEDKHLLAGPNRLYGYGLLSLGAVDVAATVSLGAWHHVVYEYDGAVQRLYIDGIVVGSLSTPSASFSNASGLGHVGGSPHTGFELGFLGYLDSLRVSSIARYGGSSFVPILGDFAADLNTLVLYNFDDFTDSSANGLDGTPGIGFSGATSPLIVSYCGNDIVDAGEQCDGSVGPCPGLCLANCRCTTGEVPAVSEWGLAVTGLLGLTIGTVVFARLRRAQRGLAHP